MEIDTILKSKNSFLAHFWYKKRFLNFKQKKSYMVRSGTWCRTLCTMNFFWTNFFDVFYIKKPCHRLAIAILGNTLPIMAPKSALAPRLSRSIRVPQPPYSSMWCPEVAPKRSERLLAANGCVGNRIVFVMRGFGNFRSKNHGVILLPSWRWNAPMARLGPTHGANTGSRAPKFGYEVL